MTPNERDRLRSIRTFPSLVKYLRDDLGWPIDTEDFEDLTFDYEPDELGIDARTVAKIEPPIKQLRPLTSNQPWGIFFVKFSPKRLPVVALRRILSQLVFKQRASAKKAEQATWNLHDLLFISNYGEGEQRQINLAHFAENDQDGDLPTLKVLGWDGEDTELYLDHVGEELQSKLTWPENPKDIKGWRERWSSAFTLRHREVITTSKELAIRLAELARGIRKKVNSALAIESEKGLLRKLMTVFREALIHDLKEDDFADMYAQTIAYGLLTARVSRPAGLVADSIADMVPITNPFLKELMETFLHIGGRRNGRRGAGVDFDELGINDVVQLLRDANVEAVLRDFGNLRREEDPVIHFYELFLKEYDPKKRMQRGVFYTPRPVVSYIVRSVHELLQTEFGLEDGLASTVTWGEMVKQHKDLRLPEIEVVDPKTREVCKKPIDPATPFVQILDPAAGTATFLVEVLDVIHKTMTAKWKKQGHTEMFDIPKLWNEYVPKHLLPRLHGYELMMAPYAIAHMKIGLKLFETGYRFGSDERARVYLTNALEPPQDFSDRLAFDAPALAHEAHAVNTIKRHQRFAVVVGNPPYSIMSANLSPDSRKLVDSFRHVDGEPIKEKSAIVFERTLQDDYVKFLAIGINHILAATAGVLGYITNNSYLENINLRGLRFTILRSFDHVGILDLHGDADLQEPNPGASKDENVFDIKKGVAILICDRRHSHSGGAETVVRGDLLGTRVSKYETLLSRTCGTIGTRTIRPRPDRYIFTSHSDEIEKEFEAGTSLATLFLQSATGIETGKDSILTAFDKTALSERLQHFGDPRGCASICL